MTLITASAPAKVILFGEHLVVHGGHAILASIDKRITVKATSNSEDIRINSMIGSISQADGSRPTYHDSRATELLPLLDAASKIVNENKLMTHVGLDIDIRSDIRPGIGLGSSAASCVAVVAAVGSLVGTPERGWICDRAIEIERQIHGTTSGADCYVSTYGGIVSYSRSEGMKRLSSNINLSLVICDTGIPHSTKEMVANVNKFRLNNEVEFEALLHEGQQIYKQSLIALESHDTVQLGHLMRQNQEILRRIGVSHSKAEEIIRISKTSGALGEKITGAGGGGAVIILPNESQESDEVISELNGLGFEAFCCKIDCRGVEIQRQ